MMKDMTRAEVVAALRAVLEAANLADADGRNDLPAHAALEHSGGLYGHIKAALSSIGEGEAQAHWAECGEWPPIAPLSMTWPQANDIDAGVHERSGDHWPEIGDEDEVLLDLDHLTVQLQLDSGPVDLNACGAPCEDLTDLIELIDQLHDTGAITATVREKLLGDVAGAQEN